MKKYQLSKTKYLFIEEFEGTIRAKVGFDDGRPNGIWHTITMEPAPYCVKIAGADGPVIIEWAAGPCPFTTLEFSEYDETIITVHNASWLRVDGETTSIEGTGYVMSEGFEKEIPEWVDTTKWVLPGEATSPPA